MSVTAQTSITATAGWLGGPAGTTQTTSESGTNTSSSAVSWLSVARIPWASQFGTVVTPGASCDTNACTTTGAVGSLASMAWNPSRFQCGPSEPNIFRPVMRQPP